MVLFADESIEAEVSTFLREHGHKVYSIAEIAPSLSDIAVLDFAVRTNAILLTNDKDFGDLVSRQGFQHRGVILLRLRKMEALRKAEIVAEVLDSHGEELRSAFTVITASSVRIRR